MTDELMSSSSSSAAAAAAAAASGAVKKTPEQIIEEKGLVPRGTSKAGAAILAEERRKKEEAEIRQKAFKNANFPGWKAFTEVPIPIESRHPDHMFVVCERIHCVPPDYLPRLAAWSMAHLGSLMVPPRVPTSEDVNRAAGINIQDLFLRFSLRPVKVFSNAGDAGAFALEISKTLTGDITVLRFYEPNVQPPYTTVQTVHRDQDYQKYMKAFRRHENRERVEFESYLVDTYKEIQSLSQRSQDDTKKLIAEGKSAAMPVPANIHQTLGGDTGILIEGSEGIEMEKKRLEQLEKAEDADKEWLENALLSENPVKELSVIISTSEGFLEGFEIKAKTIQKHINLLRDKIIKARSAFEELTAAETPATALEPADETAEAVGSGSGIPIKRFMESPDGSKLYVISLDNSAKLIDPSDKHLYNVTAADTSSAPSKPTDIENTDVWYDASQPMPPRPSRTQRIAMAEEADALFGCANTEEIEGFQADMMARLREHNDRMRIQREKEKELIKQGIDPRTVYPIPALGEYGSGDVTPK